jgi:hypothetical protein
LIAALATWARAGLGLLAVAAVLVGWVMVREAGGKGRWDQDGPDTSGER